MGQVRHGSARTAFTVKAATTAITSCDRGTERGAGSQP